MFTKYIVYKHSYRLNQGWIWVKFNGIDLILDSKWDWIQHAENIVTVFQTTWSRFLVARAQHIIITDILSAHYCMTTLPVKNTSFDSYPTSMRMDCVMDMEMKRHSHYQSCINIRREKFLMKGQCQTLHLVLSLQLRENPGHPTLQAVVGYLVWLQFTKVLDTKGHWL